MTKILNSKVLYEELVEDIKQKVMDLKIIPKLGVISFGDNNGSGAYERGLKNTAKKINLEVVVKNLENSTQEEVLNAIEEFNKDDEVGGILIFRPLPEHLDEEEINLMIDVRKDVDCIHPINKAKVYGGNVSGFIPLAPKASVMLLKYYGYEFKSKDVVIVNHSNVVGKPLAMIMLDESATVSITHIDTKDLKKYTKNADYVFTAVGKAKIFDETYFNKDSVIVDIGVSTTKEGKLSGDIDEDSIMDNVEAFTPVVGGVGAITNILLLQNVVEFYHRTKKTIK